MCQKEEDGPWDRFFEKNYPNTYHEYVQTVMLREEGTPRLPPNLEALLRGRDPCSPQHRAFIVCSGKQNSGKLLNIYFFLLHAVT